MRPVGPTILTPCTGVCTLGEDGLCQGCLRTGAEIARWGQMNEVERLRLMDTILPLREAGERKRVNALSPELERIMQALHPLDTPPQAECWNIDALGGVPSATDPVAAAVLVGLVPRSSGLKVLLTRRNEAMRHHAGQVSFAGGRIEPHDLDAAAAAVRETTEETGIPGALIWPLGYLDPLATVTGFRVQPVVAVVQPHYVARPDAREVDDVFEVPFDFLMHPDNLHSLHLDLGGRPRSVLQFVDRGDANRRIWGASASILLNLRQRLETMR